MQELLSEGVVHKLLCEGAALLIALYGSCSKNPVVQGMLSKEAMQKLLMLLCKSSSMKELCKIHSSNATMREMLYVGAALLMVLCRSCSIVLLYRTCSANANVHELLM